MGSRLAWRSAATIVLAWTALAACSGSDGGSTVVFSDPAKPAEATRQASAPDATTMTVLLGLVRDSEGLARRLAEMSTPGSRWYRKSQPIAATAAEFGGSRRSIEAVLRELEENGLPGEVDVTGTFVTTTMTVAQMSSVFRTTFGEYRVPRGTFLAPDDDPVPPPAWQGHVREVMGLSTLPSLERAIDTEEAASFDLALPAFTEVDQPGSKNRSGTPSGCADAMARKGFEPNQLQTAYGVDELQAQGYLGQGLRMALVEFGGFAQNDIDAFTSCYGIENPVTPTIVLTGPVTEPLPVGRECTLDLEVVLSVAPELDGLYVFEGSSSTYADRALLYSEALDARNTGGQQIQILSSSIGSCEAVLTSGFVSTMEHLLMTAAAANVSVFASAGDSGSSACYHHDKTTEEKSASYPASSNYATGVGGTNLLLDTANALVGSSVWNDQSVDGKAAAGGGGPSILQPAPSWQGGTGTGESMRTTPDVAFLADPEPGYAIYRADNGGWYDDGGTSAATPFFAASTALIHQALLAARNAEPVVAYEWIYGLAAQPAWNDLFWDITLGNNDLFDVGCCTAGPGYDQASGWGSLDIGEAAAALIAETQYHVTE